MNSLVKLSQSKKFSFYFFLYIYKKMSTSVGHYIDFGLVEFLFPLNVTLLRLSDPTNYIQSFI